MNVPSHQVQNRPNELDTKSGQVPDENTGIVDTVTAAARGEDKPMGKTHPKAPFAMVFLAYPLVLLVALVILVIFFFFFGAPSGGEDAVQ